MGNSVSPKMFTKHVALTFSIYDPPCLAKQGWSDGMMEKNDVWETVPEHLEGCFWVLMCASRSAPTMVHGMVEVDIY